MGGTGHRGSSVEGRACTLLFSCRNLEVAAMTAIEVFFGAVFGLLLGGCLVISGKGHRAPALGDG